MEGTGVITVAYADLVVGKAINARDAKDYAQAEIDELAALIGAKGLIQPLVVRRKGARFEVYAGKRRYLAIGRLIKAGRWPKDLRVPCVERDEDDREALETSLIENIARKPMHPVREHEVFAALHGKGADVAEIAERYGVTTQVVRQRLALGGLAREIRDAWRHGEINADTARAFAVCQDKQQQAATFAALGERRQLNASAVRSHLVKDRPRITDRRVAFVGLDRYKAAGGRVVESLFADDGWLEDGDLLARLAEERLAERCAELVADGWSFAFPASEVKGNALYYWQRLQPKVGYTPEEQARLDEIAAEREALEKAEETDWEAEDALDARQEAIEEAARPRAFTPKQKAQSGCVLSVSDDEVRIEYGLVRPAPAPRAGGEAAGDRHEGESDADGAAANAGDGQATISNALILSLTEQQTVAAARTLVGAPELAVVFAIAGLRSYSNGPVRLSSDGYAGVRGDHHRDMGAFDKALKKLESCEDLGAELAKVVAQSLDLRVYHAPHSADQAGDSASGEALVAALPGEAYLAHMRELFDPADYFKRAPARVASAAIAEIAAADRAEAVASLPARKADLAEIAAEKAKRLGWLPAELRHPDYALEGQAPKPQRRKRARAAA